MPYRFDELRRFGDSFLLIFQGDEAERNRVRKCAVSAAIYHGRRRGRRYRVWTVPEGVRVTLMGPR